jgi:hypothetical protein
VSVPDWSMLATVDSFPPVYVVKMAPDEARRLHATYLADEMRGIPAYRKAVAKLRVMWNWKTQFHEDPLDWYAVQPHPYLSRLLPDVTLHVSPVRRVVFGWDRHFFALRKGKVYEPFEDINTLMYDSGMRFGADDIPVWTRALTIYHALGWSILPREWEGIEPPDLLEEAVAGERPLFPAFVIERVACDTSRPGVPRRWPVEYGKVHMVNVTFRMDTAHHEFKIWTVKYRRDGRALLVPIEPGPHRELKVPSS